MSYVSFVDGGGGGGVPFPLLAWTCASKTPPQHDSATFQHTGGLLHLQRHCGFCVFYHISPALLLLFRQRGATLKAVAYSTETFPTCSSSRHRLSIIGRLDCFRSRTASRPCNVSVPCLQTYWTHLNFAVCAEMYKTQPL